LECGGVDYITKPFNQAELLLRVQTHLALKAARDRLKRLAEDKEELLGILAHDLKNHVGGMHMTAQLLRDRLGGDADPRLRQMANHLASASGRTLTFLREFLANAASDHGLNKVELSNIELNGIAQQAVDNYLEAAQQKDQKVERTFEPGGLLVRGDTAATRQVLDNLISTAVKFSPPGSVLRVATKRIGTTAEISVQAQGPGITPADRERLFRRYTRLSARPTGGEPSTGLGLSIVQKLVNAMSGTITCTGAPGGGTCFIVKLPL